MFKPHSKVAQCPVREVTVLRVSSPFFFFLV